MKNSVKNAVVIVSGLAIAAGCSGGSSAAEKTGATAAALNLPGLTPTPINPATGASAWQGSQAELMFADAFASCSDDISTVSISAFTDINNFNFGTGVTATLSEDAYLEAVRQQMSTAACINGATNYGSAVPAELGWFQQRNDAACNIDPSTKANASVGLVRTVADISVPNSLTGTFENEPSADNLAAEAVQRPVMNYCIAQHLRSMAPGTMGGQALLLSAADQRELLELEKERAQLAMLQFALLEETFATPAAANAGSIGREDFNAFSPTSTTGYAGSFLPVLQDWAQGASGARLTLLATLGQDFASAVQLHVQVSQELVGLLGRSGSARLPRGGSAIDPAQDIWGSGSWRQRALASLFGGDPLVQDPDNTSPWHHFLSQTAPGQRGENWPTPVEDPFVSIHVKDPSVSQLWRLATSYDALTFSTTPIGVAIPLTGLTCQTIVVPDSATLIYQSVEAGLRTSDCVTVDAATQTCHVYSVTDIPNPATSPDGYASFEIWKRFQITPQHALTLAQLAAQEIPERCVGRQGGATITQTLRGALDFDGTITSTGGRTGALSAPGTYHLSSNSILQPRVVREVAALYGRNAHFQMPTTLDPTADASTQGYQLNTSSLSGFSIAGNAHEEMRTMGSVAALAATRIAILASQANVAAGAAGVKAFAATSNQILDLIDGSAGTSQIAISPRTTTTLSPIVATFPNSPIAVIDGGPSNVTLTLDRNIVLQAGTATAEAWNVDLVVPAADAFYDTTNAANYTLFSVPGDPVATTLARYPNANTFDSRNIVTTLAGPLVERSTATTAKVVTAGSKQIGIWHFDLSVNPSNPQRSLIVQKTVGGVTSYKPLLSNLELASDTVGQTISDGQYFAFEGTLSNNGQSIITRDQFDPAAPAFDGFGLPNRLAPPTDPSLFAGAAGTDPVANYLAQAQTAAEDATQSVTQTFQELLNEEQDQSQLAAAVAKQQSLDDLQRSALCGTGSTCDTSVVLYGINIQAIWDAAPATRTVTSRDPATYAVTTSMVPRPEYYNALTGCGNGSINGNDADALDCLTISVLKSIPSGIKILNVVAQHLNDPNPQGLGPNDTSPPAFTEFQGGALQTIAIQQWLAIQKAKAEAVAVIAASDAAFSQVQSFVDAFFTAQNQNAEMVTKCSLHSLAVLFQGCRDNEGMTNPPPCAADDADSDNEDAWDDETTRSSTSDTSQAGGGSVGFSFFVSVSGNLGGGSSSGSSDSEPSLAEKIRLCQESKSSVSAAQWQLVDAQLQAVASIQEKATEFLELGGALQESSAGALQTIHQTDLAIATEALETSVLAASQKTSFGLYRQIHSYDVFRSQALLDNARLMADVARKAIESRYVVNLSELTEAEPFVASPSTWADDIYQYDLSMPDTVGLSLGDAVPGGVSLNKVLDYVGNLQRFVQGYAIARPTAVAQADTEVLTLPGPVGLDDGTSPVTQLPDGRSASWSYFCPSSATWVPLPIDLNPMDACLPGDKNPTQATLQFDLDPWGRVDGDFASPPFALRYNERWTNLAVNIVGTGVLDCTKAADPLGCYSKSYISYDLTQAGVPWITDSNESWNVLGVPTGEIESAKALAAEQWLDPINNAWDKPYVAQVTRSEFTQRPYGGRYALNLQLGPEVQLQNIERVQILAGSSYWVSQK